jgi:putative addiction module component (TIGR02574 family)
MSGTAMKDVQEAALQLSDEERGQLAEALLDSIRTDEEREIETLWAPEIERRIAAIEAGTATLIPADEVLRELKSKYAPRRRSR